MKRLCLATLLTLSLTGAQQVSACGMSAMHPLSAVPAPLLVVGAVVTAPVWGPIYGIAYAGAKAQDFIKGLQKKKQEKQ